MLLLICINSVSLYLLFVEALELAYILLAIWHTHMPDFVLH